MTISGYIDLEKLAAEIERVKLKLGPESGSVAIQRGSRFD